MGEHDPAIKQLVTRSAAIVTSDQILTLKRTDIQFNATEDREIIIKFMSAIKSDTFSSCSNQRSVARVCRPKQVHGRDRKRWKGAAGRSNLLLHM